MNGLTKNRLKTLLEQFCHPDEDDGDLFCRLEKGSNAFIKGSKVCTKVYFLLSKQEEYLRLWGFPCGVSVPENRMGEAVLLCNKWNAEMAFGRAHFSRESGLEIDACLSLQHEVSDAEFFDYINRSFRAVCDFFNKAADTFEW